AGWSRQLIPLCCGTQNSIAATRIDSCKGSVPITSGADSFPDRTTRGRPCIPRRALCHRPTRASGPRNTEGDTLMVFKGGVGQRRGFRSQVTQIDVSVAHDPVCHCWSAGSFSIRATAPESYIWAAELQVVVSL